MSERRTHYIITCIRCALSCPCCKICKELGFDLVEYQGYRGYHYQAPTSITYQRAINSLQDLGVTGFLLIACRSRVNPKEISLVRQTLKRSAYCEDNSEKDVLTKKMRASLIEEMKIEVSKDLSKQISQLDKKWEQRMSKTEKAQKEVKNQLADHDEQILGLRKDQDLLASKLTARDEEFKKIIDDFSQNMAQMRKEIHAGNREVKKMILSQQQPQSIPPKRSTQVQNSNSVPPTPGQSRPQLISHPEPTVQQQREREFPFLQTLGKYCK